MAFKIYRWAELPRQSILNDTLSRSALRTDQALVTFNYFVPGAPRPEPHSHPFDQLILVVYGRLNVEIDNEVQSLDSGSAVRVAPNLPHTAWPAGNEEVLNIDIFAPVRLDYVFLTSHQREDFATDYGTGQTTTGFSGRADV